ncbi:MAG: hypothetical protein AAB897_01700 [Patescibacteria group bacterium]
MPRIETKFILVASVLTAALLISFAIVAFAEEPASPSASQGGPEPTEAEIDEAGIVFPVAELGGCRDKSECKSYCEQPENMEACIAFAEAHGLMSQEEAGFARKFRDRLEAGGPGGCRSPRECNTYCSNTEHIEECIAFAEKNGVKDENVAEGRKVLSYIRSGGQMPGGCNSKESCEAYCSNFDHAEECFAFAEKAGLAITHGGEGNIPPGQFQKFLELAKKGETPGGCRSKNECESYCQNPDHFEECVSFGEKVGLIPPEQAALIRKTGGMGPGGCRGPRECEAYCNTPEHQEDCFKFAQEYGLVPEEELRHLKEGVASLRIGLEQAPEEVVACLKSSLGPNIITEIEAGTLVPGPAIGTKVHECFERFGQGGIPGEVFEGAPQEVLNCIRVKVGVDFDAIREGKIAPTLELGDNIRSCFEQFAPPREGGVLPGGAPGEFGFENLPPDVLSCAKRVLGEGVLEQLKAGTISGEKFAEAVKRCFYESGTGAGVQPPSGGGVLPSPGSICPAMPTVNECPPGQNKFVVFESPECGVYYGCKSENIEPASLPSFPPEVISCLKNSLSEEVVRSLQYQPPSPEVLEAIKKCYALQSGGGNLLEVFRPLLPF